MAVRAARGPLTLPVGFITLQEGGYEGGVSEGVSLSEGGQVLRRFKEGDHDL